MEKNGEVIFEGNSVNQHREANFLLEKVKDLDKEKVNVVLDIGCADGSLTRKFREIFPQALIYGLDISTESIKYAINKHYPENITFLVQDISQKCLNTELEQLKCRVDLIFSNMTLQWAHVDLRHQAVANIYDLLSLRGHLVINVGLPEDPREGATADQKVIISDYLREVNYNNEYKNWVEFFKQTGFKDVQHQIKCMDYFPFDGFDDFQKKIKLFLPVYKAYYKAGLPSKDWEKAQESICVPAMRIYSTKLDKSAFWGDLNGVKKAYVRYFTLTGNKSSKGTTYLQ